MSNVGKESEFWKFMEINGPKGEKSKGNYISWLRFVSDEFLPIDESIDKTKIEEVCTKIKNSQNERAIYTRDNDVSNIKSALNKYQKFNESASSGINLSVDLIKIINQELETSKKSEIETRIGQGKYRKELIKIWGMCSLSQYCKTDFLVASHIKPWKDSTNYERTDPYNGLLLKPNFDKLFDAGYITFENNGNIVLSALLEKKDFENMGVYQGMKIFKVCEKHKPYLDFHQNSVFLK